MVPSFTHFTRTVEPNFPYGAGNGSSMLLGVGILWGSVVLTSLACLWLTGYFDGYKGYYYLLPWCFLTGMIVGFPIAYQYYKGRFDPSHPVIFASWSFFLPGYFIGGIALALGYSQPYFMAFVADETTNLPLTFVYIIVGFVGLGVGFLLPAARNIGRFIGNKLPDWNWTPEQVLKPALILLVLGLANTIIAFIYGVLGFQKVEEVGAYDGLIYLLSLFWLEACFLLWLYVFRSPGFDVSKALVLLLLVGTALARTAAQGNRSSLIAFFTLIVIAYACSGRRIGLKQSVVGAALVFVALIAGMIYGTTFRGIKQTQDVMSIDQYGEVIGQTLTTISNEDLGVTLEKGFMTIAERLDSVSSLAVVVSNYERLAPLGEAYGIENNILKEALILFIPRAIWPDKPITIDSERYGDLYFGYSDNSFALAPMGDLLRNFGPWGVPLGMMLVGFAFRIGYSALRENRPFSFWKTTLFFMFLTSVSYEGSFGLLFPILYKVTFIAVVGILIVRFFAGPGTEMPPGSRARA